MASSQYEGDMSEKSPLPMKPLVYNGPHGTDSDDSKEKEPPRMADTRKAIAYSIYVLILLLIAYLLNQLDRYMISICTKPMAQDIHYGDQACMQNSSQSSSGRINCTSTNEISCVRETDKQGTQHVCEWNYNGQGIEYELLAGPVFIVVYTIAGIPLGFLADVYNRKNMLAGLLTFWSLMTVLTGLAKEYWHLAILRFALGIGQAGCTPLATSLIADYFDISWRASAIGVYNWGIYFGYSLAYAVGNFVTSADILGQGWRWAFYVSGIPGLIIGPLMFFSVKEPERQVKKNSKDSADLEGLLGPDTEVTCCKKAAVVFKTFLSPSLLLLCLAGSLRNAAGYVWAYNTQVYYESIHQTPEEIGKYMAWIPLVGGSIGVVLGGFISDRVVKRVGPYARIVVIVVSQLLAAPFVAGALFLDPPYAYLILIPGYIIGEMWVGITLTVLVELVPTSLRTVAVAVYLFIISNIGGNVPLLVPIIQTSFINIGYTTVDALRAALYILYPGMYVAGAIFYFFTILVMKWDLKRVQNNYESIEEDVVIESD